MGVSFAVAQILKLPANFGTEFMKLMKSQNLANPLCILGFWNRGGCRNSSDAAKKECGPEGNGRHAKRHQQAEEAGVYGVNRRTHFERILYLLQISLSH